MPTAVTDIFAVTQIAYLASLLVVLWLYTRPVDTVKPISPDDVPASKTGPEILVFYPVLHEPEATIRTAMLGFERARYPNGRFRIVAIPNSHDSATIASLYSVAADYPFLEVLKVPPTNDKSWQRVWDAWDQNPKAYWWHTGKRAHDHALPPKKTRQLVYALYTMAADHPGALLSYIDADSVVPADYFVTAAAGIKQFDVLQTTNIAGNAMASLAASLFAMDHMQWDGSMYPHMSAHGKHPYYVLGKGLFYKVSDLIELGGFHPWLTIEDPEVGMRLWTNGRRLGIIRSPLVEEVPDTWAKGITQRKRWVAGFFQSLSSPLKRMGMSPLQRARARLNFVPCLSLILNPVGITVGTWALIDALTEPHRVVPLWLEFVCFASIGLSVLVMALGQRAAFRQTRLLYPTLRERLVYMLRVNPVFIFIYWLYWAIPLAIGFWMYVTDTGLHWERTEKLDTNREAIVTEQLPVLTEQAAYVSERENES